MRATPQTISPFQRACRPLAEATATPTIAVGPLDWLTGLRPTRYRETVLGFLRMLASLPLVWLGKLVAPVSPSAGIWLLERAWRIGGDGSVAVAALNRLLKQAGAEAALAKAEQWLAIRPQTQTAVRAGLLSAQLGRYDRAAEHLATARRLGLDRDGLIELLELGLAFRNQQPPDLSRTLRRMVDRRDLSLTESAMVLDTILWQNMLQGDLPVARQYALRLLAVSDYRPARMALWAICRKEGRHAEADRHWAAASKMPPGSLLYTRYLVQTAIGEDAAAAEALTELEQRQAELAEQARQVVTYWRSAAPCP